VIFIWAFRATPTLAIPGYQSDDCALFNGGQRILAARDFAGAVKDRAVRFEEAVRYE